ncbi:MAG: hypothetical protein R2762_14755 [Bryobacteraceae bacterium]
MPNTGFLLLLCAALGIASAADSIGVAQATGGFALNGARVTGNATLFDGATIETDRASSRLRLSSGARIELGPASKARISPGHLNLEKGASDVSASSGFTIEARTLRIAPAASAVAKVTLEGERTVLVAAANGPVRIYNHLGELLANVRAGSALSVLPPLAAQAEGSSLTGCLVKRDGRYVLTDATTGVTVELRGGSLEPQVGKRIKVEGTVFRTATPIEGASQVIRVSTAAPVEGDPCTPPAAATTTPSQTPSPAASTPRPPVAEAGGSKVSGAVIGVIVAGAGAGAVGAALALGGDNKSR